MWKVVPVSPNSRRGIKIAKSVLRLVSNVAKLVNFNQFYVIFHVASFLKIATLRFFRFTNFSLITSFECITE